MKISELLKSFPGKNKNKIYELLINKYDCGPFDGGCVIFARALQIKYNGYIVVLTNAKDIAQHAALYKNGQYIDADGSKKIDDFIKNFEKNESVIIEGIRQINKNDLLDAPRDEKLSEEIAKLL